MRVRLGMRNSRSLLRFSAWPGGCTFNNAAARPSTVTWADYNQLSTAFFQSVNNVLTRAEFGKDAARSGGFSWHAALRYSISSRPLLEVSGEELLEPVMDGEFLFFVALFLKSEQKAFSGWINSLRPSTVRRRRSGQKYRRGPQAERDRGDRRA